MCWKRTPHIQKKSLQVVTFKNGKNFCSIRLSGVQKCQHRTYQVQKTEGAKIETLPILEMDNGEFSYVDDYSLLNLLAGTNCYAIRNKGKT